MQSTHMRAIPKLAPLAIGTLILGGLLAAGLVWSMLR
jgi:hypothetical protein